MTTDWLNALVLAALDRRWCTRVGCTTCGMGKLRSGVRDAAIAQLRAVRGAPTSDADFTEDEIVRTVIDGLRGLQADLADTAVTRAIVEVYRNPWLTPGVSIVLADALSDTAVGDAMLRWKEQAAAWAHERAERERARLAAADERRRLKQEAAEKRAARKLERDRHRSEFLRPR